MRWFGRTKEELWCHDCEHYVQFQIDRDLDGNHVFPCQNCGHEHCRVVKNGRITDIRWDRRNGPTVRVRRCSITTSTDAVYTTSSTSSTADTYSITLSGSAGGTGGYS